MVDFTHTSKGLEVQFFNLSEGYPLGSTCKWEFGDVSSSTEDNPIHNYSRSRFYRVVLSIIDPSGNLLDQASKKIAVSEFAKTQLPDTIYNLIDSYIPPEIFGELTTEIKQQFIGKWQLYIQPLVNHLVPLEEYNNETYYEALENQLIMELSAYDFMVLKLNHMISAASARVTENNSTSSSDQGSESSNSIKKIITGPTEVEYFDTGNEDNDTITGISKASSILSSMKDNICMLAERLDIYLPICRETNDTVLKVPKVVNRRVNKGLSGPNPSTIVKK